MTKSTMHSVKGIAQWAKVFEQNRDMGDFHKDYNGQTSIDVILEPDQLAILAASGSRHSPKPTEDGIKVKFRRKWEHPTIPALGGAPKVVNAEDQEWSLDEFGLIGNNSEVEVFFTVYDTKMGKGTRLEGIRVLNHVAYETEYDPEEMGADARLPF